MDGWKREKVFTVTLLGLASLYMETSPFSLAAEGWYERGAAPVVLELPH